MDNDKRIAKKDYKQEVEKEKKKLMKQVIFLTIFAIIVSGSFYMSLYFHTKNEYE